jgi:hypothetical protein
MLALGTKSNGKCGMRQCCVWTSCPPRGVVLSMDDDIDDLIAQLYTRIGMIMEDASVVALTIGGLEREKRVTSIDEVETAANRIAELIAATKALMD